MEVEDHLCERQLVAHLYPGSVVRHVALPAPPLLAERQHGADILRGHVDRGQDHGLLDPLDVGHGRQRRRALDLDLLAATEHDAVAHGGRRRDQLQAVLALETLSDDLGVQEAEEAAAKAEAESDARLGLVDERGIVELQLLERGLEVLVVVGVDGVETAEDHRFHLPEAGQRLLGATLRPGHGVADAHLRQGLDPATTIPTSPAASRSTSRG